MRKKPERETSLTRSIHIERHFQVDGNAEPLPGLARQRLGFGAHLRGETAVPVDFGPHRREFGLGLVGRREFGQCPFRALMRGFGFAVYGLAPTGWIFCLGVPVMALWGLASPAAGGLMSKHV